METNVPQLPAGDAPNSPEIGADVQAHVPAIKDIGQAVALVKALQNENREREKKNARIQEKYNAERPFNPEKLKADGLGWMPNFSTKPLATLIDKVVPRFTTALRQMRYLTAAKLPDRFPNAAEKTEIFRREITETCRGHEGWDEFISELAQENVLFGYTAVGWLGTFTWMPKHYRQEDFLVPQGTKHTSRSAQVVAFREPYLLHDLFDHIRDPKAAQTIGWNVPNVVKSINEAAPDNVRSNSSDLARVYADLQRESSVLTSFTGAKTVNVWHVFVTEVDGHVTHVAYDERSGDELFWRDKQFPSMSDAAAFFSFQHGNGKLHGSKGIGRELYNMAGVIDRSRNEVMARLQLSGKLLLQCDEREIKRFRASVVGPALLIASPFQIQQQKIDGAVEEFLKLDQFLTELLDQVAGSTSPKAFEGERVTKAAVELYAAREEERRDAIIERFLTQFARMMSTTQRRLCDPRTIDVEAKEMQQRLLAVMSPEELAYLAKQPAVSTVRDYTESERQQIALLAQENKGNPLFNQVELAKADVTAKISAEFAKQVVLPQNDPTEEAENTRQQQTELLLLQSGQQVPVSPRDNHVVHLNVLQQAVSGMLESAVDNPQTWPVMDALGAHAMAHLQAAQQAGLNKEIAPFQQFFTSLGHTLQQLEKGEQEARDQAATQSPPAEAPPAAAIAGMANAAVAA